jgi:hypothetical protein
MKNVITLQRLGLGTQRNVEQQNTYTRTQHMQTEEYSRIRSRKLIS